MTGVFWQVLETCGRAQWLGQETGHNSAALVERTEGFREIRS